jgi:uncharacterized membrane protein YphA (DoxX/SURF4 family)
MEIGKNKIEPIFLLRLFLGLVFLSAGFYRIFNWQEAINEISGLDMTFVSITSVFIVAIEIICGYMLIANIKTKEVLCILTGFLTFAIAWVLITCWKDLAENIGILFVYKSNPTDVFLHFVYLIILVYLILETNRQNKK